MMQAFSFSRLDERDRNIDLFVEAVITRGDSPPSSLRVGDNPTLLAFSSHIFY